MLNTGKVDFHLHHSPLQAEQLSYRQWHGSPCFFHPAVLSPLACFLPDHHETRGENGGCHEPSTEGTAKLLSILHGYNSITWSQSKSWNMQVGQVHGKKMKYVWWLPSIVFSLEAEQLSPLRHSCVLPTTPLFPHFSTPPNQMSHTGLGRECRLDIWDNQNNPILG